MPTKLFSLMSARLIGLTSITAQLSASFTATELPSRVAIVAVLPSIAAIEPRSRVGGLAGGVWARVSATNPKDATNAAAAASIERMVVIRRSFCCRWCGAWHGRLCTAAYVCVRLEHDASRWTHVDASWPGKHAPPAIALGGLASDPRTIACATLLDRSR